MQNRPWNEPLVIPAVGMTTGVLLDRWSAFYMAEALAVATFFGLLAMLPVRIVLRRILIGLAAAGIGIASAVYHRPGPPPVIEASAQETLLLEGCVVEPSVFAENREQFTVELAPGARGRVSLNLREGQQAPHLRYGQRVEFEGKVRKPHNFGNPGHFDYEGYLARRQIYWNISTRTGAIVTVLPGECGDAVQKRLFDLRGTALERIEQLYAGDDYTTILMQAILVGENTRMERSWTEHFRRSGTYHALVISGLHLTVLAGNLLFLLRYTTGRLVPSLLLSFLAAWIYTAACGLSAPIVRAAGGFTLFLVAAFWHRDPRLLNALGAITVVFLALDPCQLFEGSFLLSVLSVLAISAIASPIFETRTRPLAFGFRQLHDVSLDVSAGWSLAAMRVEARLAAETLSLATRLPYRAACSFVEYAIRSVVSGCELVLLSAVVQLALALPMVLFFHRVSFSGLVANVVIVPVMNLVVIIGFLAVATMFPPLAAAAGWLLQLARRLAEWFSAAEPNWRMPDPPLWLALSFAGALVLFALTARGRRPFRRAAGGLALALAALILIHPFPVDRAPEKLEVTAIDVGQGDSILIVTPEGKTVLVDSGGIPVFKGRPRPKMDIGEDVVSSYLWTRSVRTLDVMALTHAHEDHSGGMAALIANFQPRELWVGAMGPSETWRRIRGVAEAYGVKVVSRKAGEKVVLGGAEFDILAPLQDYVPDDTARNNDSLVMTVRFGRRSVLLTGDLEKEMEWRLVSEGKLGPVDVLKVGHHGSRTSSTEELLAATQPLFGIISAGLDNLYRHPHPDIVLRMERHGVRVLRTDRSGLVRILTDGRRLEVEKFAPSGEVP